MPYLESFAHTRLHTVHDGRLSHLVFRIEYAIRQGIAVIPSQL